MLAYVQAIRMSRDVMISTDFFIQAHRQNHFNEINTDKQNINLKSIFQRVKELFIEKILF